MRTLVKVLLRLQLRDGHAIPRRPDGMDHRLGAPWRRKSESTIRAATRADGQSRDWWVIG